MNDTFTPVYEAKGSLPVRLETAPVEHPPGNFYVHHRLVVAEGRPGVVIVARRGDEVLLVLSNRRGAGLEMWELPRGSSEAVDALGPEGQVDDFSDDTIIRAASRELLEETGWHAHEPRVIGRYLTDSTVFPQRIGVMACDVDTSEQQSETDGEVADARWVASGELDQLMRDGTIIDAHTLSALALLRADGGR